MRELLVLFFLFLVVEVEFFVEASKTSAIVAIAITIVAIAAVAVVLVAILFELAEILVHFFDVIAEIFHILADLLDSLGHFAEKLKHSGNKLALCGGLVEIKTVSKTLEISCLFLECHIQSPPRLCAGEILAGSGVDLDDLANLDEEGNLDLSAGLNGCGLEGVGCSVACEAGVGIGDL